MRRRTKRFIALLLLVTLLLFVWQVWNGKVPLASNTVLPAGKIAPQLACDSEAGVMLAPDGSLWAWGGSGEGLVPLLGQSNLYNIPHRISAERDWQKIAATSNHLLAQKSNGTLWRWVRRPGEGKKGSPMPSQVNTDTDWIDFAVGAGHSIALKRDGSLWTWGRNAYGQLGFGGTNALSNPTHVVGDYWRSIAAGAFNSYAIRADGTVWGWGSDSIGGAGGTNDFTPRQIEADTNWVALSASSYCLLALKRDGSLWLRGQNAPWAAPNYIKTRRYPFTRIGTDTDWKEIHCGEHFFFARKVDGTWWVCGSNHYGQLGLGEDENMDKVDAPRRFPFAFDPWAMVASSDGGTTLILLRDGSLWSAGIQLGAPLPSARMNTLKFMVNGWLKHVPGKPYLPAHQFRIDPVPRKIWTLPPNQAPSR